MLSWSVCRVADDAEVAQDGGNEDDLSLGMRAYHPLAGCLVIPKSQDPKRRFDLITNHSRPSAKPVGFIHAFPQGFLRLLDKESWR